MSDSQPSYLRIKAAAERQRLGVRHPMNTSAVIGNEAAQLALLGAEPFPGQSRHIEAEVIRCEQTIVDAARMKIHSHQLAFPSPFVNADLGFEMRQGQARAHDAGMVSCA